MYRLIFFRLSESYFRHRWLYLLPILLLMLFGAGYLVITKPSYTAQGILYIQTDTYLSQLTQQNTSTTSTNFWNTPAQATSNEINELIQTDAFIRAVIQETNLEKMMNRGPKVVSDTIDAVRKDVWVTPQGDNQVSIGAKYEDSQVAVQLANGVIDNYIRWHTNGRRNDSEVALAFFTNLIGQYRSELEKAHTAMADYIQAHPAPQRGDRTEMEKMDIARLQSDITLAENRYSSAMEKEENARLSLAQIDSEMKQIFTVIDAPHIPPNTNGNSKKDMAIKMGIFTGVGLLLSAGLIVGTALFDHSFLLPSDIQGQLSLPVLAVIPDTSPTKKQRRMAARKAKLEAKRLKQLQKQQEKQQKLLEKAQEVQALPEHAGAEEPAAELTGEEAEAGEPAEQSAEAAVEAETTAAQDQTQAAMNTQPQTEVPEETAAVSDQAAPADEASEPAPEAAVSETQTTQAEEPSPVYDRASL